MSNYICSWNKQLITINLSPLNLSPNHKQKKLKNLNILIIKQQTLTVNVNCNVTTLVWKYYVTCKQYNVKMANKKNSLLKTWWSMLEQIWTQICSAFGCQAGCINEALIGLTATVAIATKTTSKPQCGF